MPVARIVARNITEQSPAFRHLAYRLRADGYDVELAAPGTGNAGADLLVELDQLPAHEALDGAVQLARENDADLFVASGLFAAEILRTVVPHEQASELSGHSQLPPSETPAKNTSVGDKHSDVQRSVVGVTLDELSAAMADSRAGMRDSVSGVRARIGSAWQQFQKRRADAAQARRLERERRDIEREERRRHHQFELQRRAEEKQRMLSERERVAAERDRVVREQMAREAALRAERERAEREAMARDAAHRAELARAAEQERRRVAAVEADRLRVLREQEVQRAPALAAEQLRMRREAEAQPLAAQAMPLPEPVSPVHDPGADAAPVLKPKLVRRPRHTPSARERHWQRAAFIASVATLAAMIGYAIAANMHPASPLPASLIQNSAEQQVPFGPARMDVSAAAKSPRPDRSAAAPSEAAGYAGKSTVQTATSRKPSAAKQPARSARRARSAREIVADDEVVVHHAPAAPQRAQTTSGVRRYSDDN